LNILELCVGFLFEIGAAWVAFEFLSEKTKYLGRKFDISNWKSNKKICSQTITINYIGDWCIFQRIFHLF
jgi:hypothetical protein